MRHTAILAITALTTGASALTTYDLRPLPPLSPGRPCVAHAISADGRIVVGAAQDAEGAEYAVMWVMGGSPTVLEAGSVAVGVSDAKEAALLDSDSHVSYHSTLTGAVRLATGSNLTVKMNEDGAMADSGDAPDGSTFWSIWTPKDGVVDAGSQMRVYGFNNAMTIVGKLNFFPCLHYQGDFFLYRFLYRRISAVDGSAVAVSDTGAVVITDSDRGDLYRGYVSNRWPEPFAFAPLRCYVFTTRQTMTPRDINDSRTIVGEFGNRRQMVPFVKFPETGAIDLDALLANGANWTMESAKDINDAGWIAGSAVGPTGVQQAVYLRPQ